MLPLLIHDLGYDHGIEMTRYGGLILMFALALVALYLRIATEAGAETLLVGEVKGRQTLEELYRESFAYTSSGRPHPGLETLTDHISGLDILESLGALEVSYAQDDVYLYAFTATSQGSARRTHGFILRAWPRSFGTTGDREFYIDDGGILYEGLNRKGRTGIEASGGFPPPMPDPLVGQPNSPWFPAVAAPTEPDPVEAQR